MIDVEALIGRRPGGAITAEHQVVLDGELKAGGGKLAHDGGERWEPAPIGQALDGRVGVGEPACFIQTIDGVIEIHGDLPIKKEICSRCAKRILTFLRPTGQSISRDARGPKGKKYTHKPCRLHGWNRSDKKCFGRWSAWRTGGHLAESEFDWKRPGASASPIKRLTSSLMPSAALSISRSESAAGLPGR